MDNKDTSLIPNSFTSPSSIMATINNITQEGETNADDGLIWFNLAISEFNAKNNYRLPLITTDEYTKTYDVPINYLQDYITKFAIWVQARQQQDFPIPQIELFQKDKDLSQSNLLSCPYITKYKESYNNKNITRVFKG